MKQKKQNNSNNELRPLVIIDFSHLYVRSLYASIRDAKPTIINGKYVTNEIEHMFKHTIFNILKRINTTIEGEMLLALDDSDYWRKDVDEHYKGTRKLKKQSEKVNWVEIKEIVDKITDEIPNYFPFKVLKVHKAEADDIAGVLCEKLDRPIILVTSDHDWMQNLVFDNVKMYDDMKKKYRELTEYESKIVNTPVGEISNFTLLHTLIGDSGDNVQNCVFETEFSEEFKKFLKKKGFKNLKNTTETNELNETICKSYVKEIQSLPNFDKLVEEFDIYEKVKTGKLTGEIRIDYRTNKPQKKIWHKTKLGKVRASKIMENQDTLNKFLNSHELYMNRFIKTNKLVDFRNIPKYIKDAVIEEYNNAKANLDTQSISEYFAKNNLNQHYLNHHNFYDDSKASKEAYANKDGFYNPFL